jgi:hypothetical protein
MGDSSVGLVARATAGNAVTSETIYRSATAAQAWFSAGRAAGSESPVAAVRKRRHTTAPRGREVMRHTVTTLLIKKLRLKAWFGRRIIRDVCRSND